MAKTIKVRIAVAVTAEGEWRAEGDDEQTDKDKRENATWSADVYTRISWVEAEVPLPDEDAIEGTVTPAHGVTTEADAFGTESGVEHEEL